MEKLNHTQQKKTLLSVVGAHSRACAGGSLLRASSALLVVLCFSSASSHSAHAQSWKRIATDTTLTNNQLCKTDGTNIICDTTTPTIVSGLVGIGTTSPLVSLDLSKETDALALPVGTTGTRPTTAVTNGEIRYNSTTLAVEAYINNTWSSLATSSGTTSGSGTANYVARWITSTSLGIGALYDNGTNVAIGTSTPTYDLSFGGAAARTIWMERSGTAAGNNLTVQAGGGFATGTNENGGNLVLSSGITTGTGSSNVQFKLYPAGGSGAADNAALTGLTISATGVTGTNAVTTLQANAGSGSNQNGGALILSSGVSTGTGTSNINFNVYGAGSTGTTANTATTAMTVASTGYVGIGTTSPLGTLDVYGGSFNMVLDNSNASVLQFDHAGSQIADIASITGAGSWSTDSSINDLVIRTQTGKILFNTNGGGGASTMAVNGSNVGIGTTSPTQALQVNGNILVSVGHSIESFDLSTPANAIPMISMNNGNYIHVGDTYRNIYLDTGASNSVLVSGSVGIGSTTPDASLDLSQKTDAVSLPVGTTGTRPTAVNGMIRYNTALPGLEAYINGVWSTLQASGTTSGVLTVPNGGTGDPTLTAHSVMLGEGTSAVGTAGSGNQYTVLVGNGASTDPSFSASPTLSGVLTDLQSIGSTSTDGLDLTNSTAATAGQQQWSPRLHYSAQGWKTNATAASQNVDFITELQTTSGAAAPTGNMTWSSSVNGAAYSGLMTLSSNGNLGIGTAPGYPLQVTRSGQTIIMSQSTGGDGNSAEYQLLGAGANAAWSILTNKSAVGGAVDSLAFYKESGTSGVKLVIQDNGNVGIGTTSPLGTLDVYGGSFNMVLDNSNASVLQFDHAGSQIADIASITGAGSWSTDSSINDLVIRTQTGKILFNTNGGGGASTMAVNGSNVGVGTTSPAANTLMDVRGMIASTARVSNGTFPTITGCGTPGSPKGGTTTGTFTAGSATCAPAITALPTAPNGWWCSVTDMSATANVFVESSNSTTSCTFTHTTGTVATGNTLIFHAEAY